VQAQGDVRPEHDTGDFVVIVNAEKIVLHRQQAADKMVYRHSGYPGGIKRTPIGVLLERHPERVLENAIRACCPRIAWPRDV